MVCSVIGPVVSCLPLLGELTSHIGENITSSDPVKKAYRVANVVRSVLTVAILVTLFVCPIFSFLIIPFWIAYFATTVVLDIMKLSDAADISRGACKYISMFILTVVLSALATSVLSIVFEGLELVRRTVVLFTAADIKSFNILNYYCAARSYFAGKALWNKMEELRGPKEAFPVLDAFKEVKQNLGPLHFAAILAKPEALELIQLFQGKDEAMQKVFLNDSEIAKKIQVLQHQSSIKINTIFSKDLENNLRLYTADNSQSLIDLIQIQ